MTCSKNNEMSREEEQQAENPSLLTRRKSSTNGTTSSNLVKSHHHKRKHVRDKIFVERESLLTQMFTVKEFRGLYNLFLVILINLTIYKLIADCIDFGRVDLGFSSIARAFGKPWRTLEAVATMHLSSMFVLYPAFKIWTLGGRSLLNDVWFGSFLMIFGSCFLYFPLKVRLEDSLPPASAAIVVLEQVRIFMKNYAFLRTNLRIRNARQQSRKVMEKDKDLEERFSGFAEFSYFLYAPTLVFRNNYPRTKTIRWSFVVQNIIELFGCIFLYNLLHNLCGFELLRNFGVPGFKLSRKQLLNLVFYQMIPGGIGYLLGFFILLHTAQNIFAEILRFGDRQFYKDWWNSRSFAVFYRNWNLPVHDFLYEYIYKEIRNSGFRSKTIPAIMVFIISAIVHEYVLIFVLKFFYPVLFVFFAGFGMVLSFINTEVGFGGNTFLWWSLITGKGLLLFCYTAEYFSRQNNCPASNNPFLDFITPRSWSCDAVSNNIIFWVKRIFRNEKDETQKVYVSHHH